MSNIAGLFKRLRDLVPLPPVLVGTVLLHHTDDTSTVLIPGNGQVDYGGGVRIGSLIRPRGTTVPVGKKAFVRAGVIETQAPDGEPFPIVIGEIVLPPPPPAGPWNIDLNGLDAGPDASSGVTISGLDPSAVYVVTLPPGRAYTSWDYNYGYADDTRHWFTRIDVTSSLGTSSIGGLTFYGTAAEAYAAWPGATLTGSSFYSFFLYDATETFDNLGGISLTLTKAS